MGPGGARRAPTAPGREPSRELRRGELLPTNAGSWMDRLLTRCLRSTVLVACLAVLIAPIGRTQTSDADRGAEGNDGIGRHALLVAIESYATESTGWSKLTGPGADMRAMRDALIDRASIPPENIRTLFDSEATHERILAEFRAMIGRAGKDDLILFYYSGHGSQLTDDNGDELADGLDESLVPFDAIVDGKRNDIRDDEIEALIELANQKTSRVVLIFDSCNSGTLTRAADSGNRFVPGQEPAKRGFSGKAKSRQSETTTQKSIHEVGPGGGADDADEPLLVAAEPRKSGGMHFPKTLHYVSLGACRSDQEAAEIALPGRDGTRVVRGIFTHSFVQQLYDMKAGWTYLDLMDEVRAKVRGYRLAQTPVILGNQTGQSVFAGGAVATRPFFTLVGMDGSFELQAGLVHGVQAGSVFHVQPSGASDDLDATRLGAIRVVQAGAAASEIEWIDASDEVDRTTRQRYRVFEASRGMGDTRLRVAFAPPETDLDIDPEVRTELLEGIGDSFGLAVSTPDNADLLIHEVLDGDTAILEIREPDGTRLPIRMIADGSSDLFLQKLNGLAMRHRVLSTRKETSQSICIDASIEKLADDYVTPLGPVDRDEETGAPIIARDQAFACRIRNCSSFPVYTSLLVISPDGEIMVAWKTSDDEPIQPDEERQSPAYMSSVPDGAESFYKNGNNVFRFVVTPRPHDLSALKQAPVTNMRRTRGIAKVPEGPLGGEDPIDDSWLTVTMEVQTKDD